MKDSTAYLDELWIKDGDKVQIKWNEDCVIEQKSHRIIWLIGKTNEYVISNIAQLLSLAPEFENINIQTKIEAIKTRDSAITVLEHELIWMWKPYMIVDWKVWWSSGLNARSDKDWNLTDTYDPSAEFVTNDVSNFVPISHRFSRDSRYLFSDYHRAEARDLETFQAVWELYCQNDSWDVFYGFNQIVEIDVSNGFEIMSDGVIRGSSNQIFYGHKKIDVKHPEKFTHSCDAFYFDGVNVYFLHGMHYNITELYELEEWEDISLISDNTYKIWKTTLTLQHGMLQKIN